MPFSRQEQLDSVSELLKHHLDIGACITEATRRHGEQTSQLTGLYEEVDKLTKSKSIVPTPELLVELANGLVSDVKALAFRDTYLDRLRLFVPAGNNPNYPEILITLRVVQQSLLRFAVMVKSESAKHGSVVLELNAIVAALEIARLQEEQAENQSASDNEEESESEDDESEEEEESEPEEEEGDPEEYDVYVSKGSVKSRIGIEAASGSFMQTDERRPYDRWFQYLEGERYFNFAMLDSVELPRYEPPASGITYVKPEK
jgi:hypothetical protein